MIREEFEVNQHVHIQDLGCVILIRWIWKSVWR